MRVVDVLYKYGQLSGLTRRNFDLTILKSMPVVESSTGDLLGDRQMKATWIQNMVLLLE